MRRAPGVHAAGAPEPLSPQAALARFDRLAAVGLQEMHGAWRGEGLPTGHPLDGWLEACGWHGKRVDSAEHVHPLVFRTARGGTVCVRPFGVRPGLALLTRLPALKPQPLGGLVQRLLPLLATRRSQARLRMTEVRGVLSATIVYDRLPIQDALRRMDADTVLGMMDLKGMAQPFFFLLRREQARCRTTSPPT